MQNLRKSSSVLFYLPSVSELHYPFFFVLINDVCEKKRAIKRNNAITQERKEIRSFQRIRAPFSSSTSSVFTASPGNNDQALGAVLSQRLRVVIDTQISTSALLLSANTDYKTRCSLNGMTGEHIKKVQCLGFFF